MPVIGNQTNVSVTNTPNVAVTSQPVSRLSTTAVSVTGSANISYTVPAGYRFDLAYAHAYIGNITSGAGAEIQIDNATISVVTGTTVAETAATSVVAIPAGSIVHASVSGSGVAPFRQTAIKGSLFPIS